ncbi:MAG: hypothetical protein NTV94_08345 [Planctomycetota bacterium]|nr:hypothetical protein [Planctomycetota bacterium]
MIVKTYLDPPGDCANQGCAVASAALVAVQIFVPLHKVACGHLAKVVEWSMHQVGH